MTRSYPLSIGERPAPDVKRGFSPSGKRGNRDRGAISKYILLGLWYIIACGTLLAVIATLSCSGPSPLAGAGSETTNGFLVGRLDNADGTPARGVVVKLLRNDYDAGADSGKAALADTTDSAGAYGFGRVDSGTYSIIGRNDSAATGILLRDILVQKSDSSITAPQGKLVKMGAIAIDIGGAAGGAIDYVFIPGTDIFSYNDGRGAVTLDRVPAGKIPAVAFRKSAAAGPGVLRYDVTVTPQDTAIVRNAAWKYSKRIFFNTSPSGAEIGRDVFDFPVLIRLNGTNFNFSETQLRGKDLRFARTGAAFQPVEIERWDSAAGRAEVWVKVDTIFGGGREQSIAMYWGNPDTAKASEGAVFDTAAGFQGVWHLGEPQSDTIRDATANHFNSVTSGTTAPWVADGMIGGCREFDGTSSCIIVPGTAVGKLNFPQNGNYTISAWVSADTLDTLSHVVVSKGTFEYYLWFTSIYQNLPYWEFVQYKQASGWECAIRPAEARRWKLLTAVCEGGAQRLYVDGDLNDTMHIRYAATEPPPAPTDLVIGRYFQSVPYTGTKGGYCWFNGKIDEVRLCNKSRSPEWIRLCYMNQRIDDKLVTFEEP